MSKEKGFSLIEVLVVITIIAVLSSYAFSKINYRSFETKKAKNIVFSLIDAIDIYSLGNNKLPDSLNDLKKEGFITNIPSQIKYVKYNDWEGEVSYIYKGNTLFSFPVVRNFDFELEYKKKYYYSQNKQLVVYDIPPENYEIATTKIDSEFGNTLKLDTVKNKIVAYLNCSVDSEYVKTQIGANDIFYYFNGCY